MGHVVRVLKYGMPYINIFILNNIIIPFCKRNTFSALANHVNIRDHHRYNRGPGSVVGIATGWTVRGSNPGVGARFSLPVQIGRGAHPATCTMGTGSFPGVKSGRGVTQTLTPSMPWSRKSRAIPLLPLRAIRPVQSLSACTVELYLYSPYGPYGLYRASVPVQ